MEENLGCRGCPGFRCLIPPAPSFSTPCWGQAWPWAPAGIWGSAPPPPGFCPLGVFPPRSPREGCRDIVSLRPRAGWLGIPGEVTLAVTEPGETSVPPRPAPTAAMWGVWQQRQGPGAGPPAQGLGQEKSQRSLGQSSSSR